MSPSNTDEKNQSGPISRVLSGVIISLGRRLPDVSSNLPGSHHGTDRPATEASLGTAPCLVLLPMGFAEPSRSPGLLVSSYLTVSTLPRETWPSRLGNRSLLGRFAFCCTFPILADGGSYPPPCPTEPGLSSMTARSRNHTATATTWPTLFRLSAFSDQLSLNSECSKLTADSFFHNLTTPNLTDRLDHMHANAVPVNSIIIACLYFLTQES